MKRFNYRFLGVYQTVLYAIEVCARDVEKFGLETLLEEKKYTVTADSYLKRADKHKILADIALGTAKLP